MFVISSEAASVVPVLHSRKLKLGSLQGIVQGWQLVTWRSCNGKVGFGKCFSKTKSASVSPGSQGVPLQMILLEDDKDLQKRTHSLSSQIFAVLLKILVDFFSSPSGTLNCISSYWVFPSLTGLSNKMEERKL